MIAYKNKLGVIDQHEDLIHSDVKYHVEYAIMGRSWSYVYLREIPDIAFKLVLFDYEQNGTHIDCRDLIDSLSDVWNQSLVATDEQGHYCPHMHRIIRYEAETQNSVDKIRDEWDNVPIIDLTNPAEPTIVYESVKYNN